MFSFGINKEVAKLAGFMAMQEKFSYYFHCKAT